jgi:putative integral membrane protein (TIGR02587 family)
MAISEESKPIKATLKEYGRGIAGGLLFSFPLLYTMEVWWAGFTASPFSLLVFVCVTFLLLLAYNRYAGLRPKATWHEVVIDSVEEMGIGFILSFAVLLMLNRIQIGEMALDEIMGKVTIEAMAVSIGVSIGTAQLGVGNGGGKKEVKKEQAKRYDKIRVAVLALCGSLIVGGNVAPTEEVTMIAVEADPQHILIMTLASLFISAIVVLFSRKQENNKEERSGFTYQLVFDTCLSYVVALAVSAFVLWFFDRFENISFWLAFSKVIVLGVLSSLGASAGRLLIK